MRLVLFLMAAVFTAMAQQASMPVGPANTGVEHAVDSKLHEDVLKLIDVDGTKTRLQSRFKQQVEDAKNLVMQACPRCTPEFGEEWTKRMLDRLQVEDFVQVIVRTYEKYLKDGEVRQLIALWKVKNESKPASLSPELKEKLTSGVVWCSAPDVSPLGFRCFWFS